MLHDCIDPLELKTTRHGRQRTWTRTVRDLTLLQVVLRSLQQLRLEERCLPKVAYLRIQPRFGRMVP
jgi:hypothetical protein